MVPFGNWQLTSDHCLFDAHKVIAQYYFDIYLSLSVVVQRAHKIGRIPCSMDRLKRPGEEIGAMMITFIIPVMETLILVKLLVTLVM